MIYASQVNSIQILSLHFFHVLYFMDFFISIVSRRSGLRVVTPLERVILLLGPRTQSTEIQTGSNLIKLDGYVLILEKEYNSSPDSGFCWLLEVPLWRMVCTIVLPSFRFVLPTFIFVLPPFWSPHV
jgi:hypothetical protein